VELYYLKTDPEELRNLADSPDSKMFRDQLSVQLAELLAAEGLSGSNDTMPLDEGIKSELPDQKIR